MEYFQWTDELSVNIEEIDHQHKEFINLTNQLSAAIKVGIGYEIFTEYWNRIVSMYSVLIL